MIQYIPHVDIVYKIQYIPHVDIVYKIQYIPHVDIVYIDIIYIRYILWIDI